MKMIDVLSNSNVKINSKSEKNNIKDKEIKFCDLLESKIDPEDKALEKKEFNLSILDKKINEEIEEEDLEKDIFNTGFINFELIESNNKVINIESIDINIDSKEINKTLKNIEKLVSYLNDDSISELDKDNILKELNFSIEKLNAYKLDVEFNKLIGKGSSHDIKDEIIERITMLIEDLNLKFNKNEKSNIEFNNESKLIHELSKDLNSLNQKESLEKNNYKDYNSFNQNNLVQKEKVENDTIEKTNDVDTITAKTKDIVLENNINIVKNNIEPDKLQLKTEFPKILNDKFNVLEQIKDRVRIIDNGDYKSAIINLKPESLGSININIDMNEGKLIGKVTVENIEIKNLLENNLNHLKETLLSRGLNIENLSVSVGKENLSDSRNKHFFNYYKNSKNIDIEEVSEEDYILSNFESYGNQQFMKNSLDFKA